MQIKSLNNLIEAIKHDKKFIYNYGLIDEATGHYIYELRQNIKRPVFLVLNNDNKARDLYESFTINNIPVSYLPALSTNYQLLQDLDFTNRSHRMKSIIEMISGENPIIITSINGLRRKLSSVKSFKDHSFLINLDSEIELEDLVKKLVDLGYEKRTMVQAKGEFSVRGDIIDIFQVHEEKPTRIELFDIEVDSIRKFDINTQMSIDTIDSYTIYPMSENYIDYKNKDKIIIKIKKDLEKSKQLLSDQAYVRAEEKFARIIENIEYENPVDNIELLIPYLEENLASIFEYLPENALVIFDDITKEIHEAKEIESFNMEDIENRIDNGELLSSHRQIYYNFDDLIKNIDKTKINFSRLLKSNPDINFDEIIESKVRENPSYHGKFNLFVDDLKYNIENKYIINIFAANKEDALKLHKDLEDKEIASKIIDSLEFDNLSKVNIFPYHLEKGFDYYQDKINFVSYNQIFKKANKKKSRTIKNKEIINYVDLNKGDLLVHDNYGIAKYLGIKNIELNGNKADYLELEYSKGDKLYVPTTDMTMISKFIGNEDNKPKLSNLNGTDWARSKNRAKKAIEEIADELVKLYATRMEIDGFSYSPDTSWQGEFEDAFPYVETDAQIRAIGEIKNDMESKKVMDRLLAGDVGYGKTEVALRAAFKAVMDSKQVVMLAPTTILVKQHFNTIYNRFKDFPINIDFLSRFKTPKEKEETIRKLKSGEIDFIVGTHALLSDKIKFDNLGLLIIDEEQRFGVKHKEKIKEISEDIDVLTLSATPIPRTLQMSLSGIRDMSILDEYPQNRLPINTYVMEYDPLLIREAILKEMAREGQIYFVYNKVRTINKLYEDLKKLVPEANIAISHGQMPTRQLENILEDFSNGNYDLLLTTTIIETGMDIQNVNTIIIYNADMMGLSQLYQLKGRVGRSSRTSYAYFTYPQGKVLTSIAEKRLKAIKDFTELGSGYKVAMRDLELRGAGNLLGESQSGHIESIGYDLYVRMLEEKIDEIKGIKTKSHIGKNVKIDLDLDAYIPDSYIEDENEKINIYKKISYIDNDQDHYAIIDELTDRFGDIPKPVQNIIDISYTRSLMLNNDMDEISEKDNQIILSYKKLEDFDFDKLKILAQDYRGDMKFDMTENPSIIISKEGNYMLKLVDLLKLIGKINKEKK